MLQPHISYKVADASAFHGSGTIYLSNYDIYGVLKASMSRQIQSVFAAICSEVVYRLKE